MSTSRPSRSDTCGTVIDSAEVCDEQRPVDEQRRARASRHRPDDSPNRSARSVFAELLDAGAEVDEGLPRDLGHDAFMAVGQFPGREPHVAARARSIVARAESHRDLLDDVVDDVLDVPRQQARSPLGDRRPTGGAPGAAGPIRAGTRPSTRQAPRQQGDVRRSAPDLDEQRARAPTARGAPRAVPDRDVHRAGSPPRRRSRRSSKPVRIWTRSRNVSAFDASRTALVATARYASPGARPSTA